MKTTSSSYVMGICAVVIASVLWGTTGTAASFAPSVSAMGIAAVVMGCGGVLQAVVAWRFIAKQKRELLKHKGLLLTGAISVAIYPLAFYSSMRLSGVTIGTVVSIGMAPLAAAVIERLCDKQRFNSRWAVSIGVGIMGVVLLAGAKPTTHSVVSVTQEAQWRNVVGLFLGLAAAFTYALYSWVAHRLIKHNIHSRAAMGSLFGIGGVLLVPVLLLSGSGLLQSSNNFLVGVYLATIPNFVGYLLFGYGLRTIRASMATLITLLEPVVAALLAMWVIGESLSWLGWTGIALISSCLLIATSSRTPGRKVSTARGDNM